MVKNNLNTVIKPSTAGKNPISEECTTKNVLADQKTNWKSCKQLPTLHMELAPTTVGGAKSTQVKIHSFNQPTIHWHPSCRVLYSGLVFSEMSQAFPELSFEQERETDKLVRVK